MSTFKITVLKKTFHQDLADEYCRLSEVSACSNFVEGQEFVIERGQRPDDFCDWAWNDIYKDIIPLWMGGNYSSWMKDGNTMITCCTDGIRPVIFKVERIQD